jgi:hypothetical protein
MDHELRSHFYIDQSQREVSPKKAVKKEIRFGRGKDNTVKQKSLKEEKHYYCRSKYSKHSEKASPQFLQMIPEGHFT